MGRETGVIDRPAWLMWGGVKYPVAEGAILQRQPLNQFAPASQIGPPDRPPVDPRLAVVTFTDLSGGRGIFDQQEISGVNRFRTATVDTRFPQGICLPPKVEAKTSCPVAWDDQSPVTVERVRTAGGDYLVAFAPTNAQAAIYSLNSDTWPTTLAHGLQALVQYRGMIVATKGGGSQGIVTSTTAATFTLSDASDWGGLCVFDNKVYSFRHDDGMLYATTDPNLGIATPGWQSVSQPLYLDYGERVHQVLSFRDRSGYPAPFVLTNQNLFGLNEDDGSWETYHAFREDAQPTYPRAIQWKRDQMLYATNFGDTGEPRLYVWQFTGSINQVGPTKVQDGQGGGFDPATDFGRFLLLRGNNHWVYGWGDNYQCAGSGEVTAMNETQGWHTVYRDDDAASPIRGGGLWGADIYVLRADGTFLIVRDRDAMTSPILRYPAGGGSVEVGPKRVYYGFTDCGLPNHWKIGSHFFLDARLRDGSPGIPSGCNIAVGYRHDNFPWTTLPAGQPLTSEYAMSFLMRTTVGGAEGWPLKIPLPLGDWDDQRGVAFRRLEMYAELSGNQAADTPMLAELSLFYSRWTDPHWAYQTTLDLSRETFARRWPEGKFEGRTLKELRDNLDAMLGKRQRWTLAYGNNEFSRTVLAADVLVAARENPARGDGIYPVTFRDMSIDQD